MNVNATEMEIWTQTKMVGDLRQVTWDQCSDVVTMLRRDLRFLSTFACMSSMASMLHYSSAMAKCTLETYRKSLSLLVNQEPNPSHQSRAKSRITTTSSIAAAVLTETIHSSRYRLVSNGEMLTGPNNLHARTHSQRDMNQHRAQDLKRTKHLIFQHVQDFGREQNISIQLSLSLSSF